MSGPWERYQQADGPWKKYERTEPVLDAPEQLVRGFNRGLNAIVALPGEVVGGAADLLGFDGKPFRWNNAISEFMTSPNRQPQTTAGRYADAVGQALGSAAIPEAGIMAAAPGIAARSANVAVPNMVQTLARSTAASPGASLGMSGASSAAAGVAQQGAADAGYGPATQGVAAMVGGFAPAALTAATRGVTQPVRQAIANQGEAGAYGAVAREIGNLDQFADDVAVGATQLNQAQARRTLDVLGDEMVRANGNVLQAQAATIARLSAEDGISPASATDRVRRLSAVHENSRLMLGEYPGAARSDAAERLRDPQNVDLDELGRVRESPVQGTFDYVGNNGNAASASQIRNTVAQRQEELGPAMRETLEAIGPQVQTGPRSTRPATIVDTEQMIDDAARMASAEYRQAYSTPHNNQVALYWLPRMLAWHERRAAGRAGEIEAAIRRATDQFYTNTPNGRLAMMHLQQLQDARGVLRGQITEYRRAGRDDLVRAVQPVYEHATRIMRQMSPQWARANARWADMEFQRMGSELGDAFATKAGPQFRQQLRELQSLAPEAQNIVRVHFLQKLYDKLDNLGDTNSVSKMFANDHSRNAIRLLFGDEAAVTFTRAIRDQRIAENTQNMMRNSATHRRGQAQKQRDAETGLAAAVDQVNARGVRNWLLERATQILTERRNQPLASVLSTPMTDTARVSMHVARMRRQQQALEAIRQRRSAAIPRGGLYGQASVERE